MGVNLRELIPSEARKEVDLRDLKGRIIALDAYNMLYQFLAAIRQPDGTPLMDREGRITSHLSGLFYRTINMAEEGIKPVYVFDGSPPEMKKAEIEKRLEMKLEADRKYKEAVKTRDIEAMRKYAQATARLTSEMVEEAKLLLKAMGIPYIQAPQEGEAQAAYIARKGDAWASGSQDYDSILFGAPRLVRNLGITGRRKLPGKDVYIEIKPEIIELDILLKSLDISREQLILIGIMLGTDYNPGGLKGVGSKTALKLVKTIGSTDEVITYIESRTEVDVKKIFDYFMNPVVTDDYNISWSQPDEKEIYKILVEIHDFNPIRVEKAIERLRKAYRENLKAKITSLDRWFG
ncbi:MAG: flap endonuclease-1 [Desulfurococcales archaeon]|nr:flap endonuclease-1 [Desulfurococcales archaeon]